LKPDADGKTKALIVQMSTIGKLSTNQQNCKI